MKIYILGWARSGKDTAAELLKDQIGMSFESSSYFAANLFIFDKLKERFDYKSVEDCFAGRHADGLRKIWHELICEFNKDDPLRLTKAIFSEFDCYVGLRSGDELLAAKNHFKDDLISIWIDAEGRIEPEPKDSCTVTKEMCDIILENKLTEEDFEPKIRKLGKLLQPLICSHAVPREDNTHTKEIWN